MEEIKGNFKSALYNLIARLQQPDSCKNQILSKWDSERGNDWFTGTLLDVYTNRGIERVGMEKGCQVVTCIKGNRLFTKDEKYIAYIEGFKIKINCNFGTLCDVEVNNNMYGGYKQKDGDNVAVFILPQKELKGVELYRAMAKRGDKYVKCFVSNENEATAEFHRNAQCVEWELIKEDGSRTFYCGYDLEGFGVYWDYVVPINSKGEILTQEEAGL